MRGLLYCHNFKVVMSTIVFLSLQAFWDCGLSQAHISTYCYPVEQDFINKPDDVENFLLTFPPFDNNFS